MINKRALELAKQIECILGQIPTSRQCNCYNEEYVISLAAKQFQSADCKIVSSCSHFEKEVIRVTKQLNEKPLFFNLEIAYIHQMKPNHRKKKLYDIFSQNLKWFLEYPGLELKGEDGTNVTDGYLCPICFSSFTEEALDSSYSNPLTLEDIPPKALGGKVRTLTCKKCNSEAGHKLDAHLVNKLQLNSVMKVNSDVKARFTLGDNSINGTFSMTEKGMLFDFKTHDSNPKSAKFIEDFKTQHGTIEGAKLRIEPLIKADIRRAELALLRIAYLYAFSELGYGMMLNGAMGKIREQLRNPEKKILSDVFWIKYQYPRDMIGFNIIREPKELRCFLIIFELISKTHTMQCAIALPGPSSPGIEIYDNIEKILCSDQPGFSEVTIEHISTKDFLLKKQYTFGSNYWWQKHCT